MGERHVEQRLVPQGRHIESHAEREPLLGRGHRDTVTGEHLVEEGPVLFGKQRPHLFHVESAAFGTHVLRRTQQVDPVRLPPGVLLDPAEFRLEQGRSVGHRPEHAESTRLRHRPHHIAAVAERHDGELDAQ